MMRMGNTLQPNTEPAIHACDEILYLELSKLWLEPALLHRPGMFPRREPRVGRRLGARDDDAARGEDERRRARLADAHDEGLEARPVVLNVARVLRDQFEVEPAVEVAGRHDVLDLGDRPGWVGALSPGD